MRASVCVFGGVVLLAGAVAWTAGCGGSDSSDGGGVETNTNEIVSIPVGVQVPGGSALDNGLEHLTAATYEGIWGGTPANNFKIMVHGNIIAYVPGGSDTYCAEVAVEAGAFSIRPDGDGTVTVTCRDFVSPRSGLVWKFFGYKIQKSTNPLITTNPLVLQASEQIPTFHVMWNSYMPASE